MKKVKLDYRHCVDHRWKQLQSRSFTVFLKTMLKLENITILVLIVLAHQINGIYSQGKHYNGILYFKPLIFVRKIVC